MTDELFDFSGKVALVTGGSRGLGREACLALARRGADIVVSSRKLEACEEVAKEVRTMGRRALAVAAHAGRWTEIEALVEASYAHFGEIDILINNAGMSPVAPSSIETEEKLIDSVIALNFKGPFRLTAMVGSRMMQGRGGSIINVSSMGAVRPTALIAPYSGAKAALNAITRAHAFEYAPKVRVNAILPGSFRTDVAKHWPVDKEASTPAHMKRFGEPNEIITSILYLASEHSSFTTGTLLRVDGGWA